MQALKVAGDVGECRVLQRPDRHRDQGHEIVAVAPAQRPLQHDRIDEPVTDQPAAVGPVRSLPGEGAGDHLPRPGAGRPPGSRNKRTAELISRLGTLGCDARLCGPDALPLADAGGEFSGTGKSAAGRIGSGGRVAELVASWAGNLMGRRYIDLLALRLAFERSGTVLPVAEPDPPAAPPCEPPLDTVTVTIPDEMLGVVPDPPRAQWVTRSHGPVGRVVPWDYDPLSPERLKLK